jgi:hypothetical protein
MKSGYDNYGGIWGNEYYDEQFDEIEDRTFVQRIFSPEDALVSIAEIPSDQFPKGQKFRCYEDGTIEIPYTGQPYDPSMYKVVKASWGHEHCYVCQFSITEGHSFWINSDGNILCDACHDHYVLGK